MILFIDIDGVLLGKTDANGHIALADHAKAFLQFALQNFDCYWLTTHCKGSIETVVDYLTPVADDEMLTLIKTVKPTYFKTFKTEALFGDFIWVDDQPTAYEFQLLEQQDQLHRWYQVNTRNDKGALKRLINELKRVLVLIRTQF